MNEGQTIQMVTQGGAAVAAIVVMVIMLRHFGTIAMKFTETVEKNMATVREMGTECHMNTTAQTQKFAATVIELQEKHSADALQRQQRQDEAMTAFAAEIRRLSDSVEKVSQAVERTEVKL